MGDRESKTYYHCLGNYFSSKGDSHLMRNAAIGDAHAVDHHYLFSHQDPELKQPVEI